MQRLLAGLTVLAVSLGVAAGRADAATGGQFALNGDFAALTGAATFAATPSCPLGATMNIVAHEDDDLLFLSPDLLHDVQAGRCVRTVFVTAGAFSGDTDYGAQREAGSQAAYALMAGVANSWTTTDAGISGHPTPLLTLAAKPTVSVVYMHLPQSLFVDPGGPTDPLLMNLWNGTIASLRTYDGSSTYTKAQLVSALTSLMTAFQPDTVRTQDYVGTFDDTDHPDHHATAYFARQAHLAYSTSHTFTGYEDYETENEPQNVFGSDLTTKTNVFNKYATYDPPATAQPRSTPPGSSASM